MVDWASVEDRLGKVSDLVIAKRLGISNSAVFARRKKLGIPAFAAEHAAKGIDWDSQPLGKVVDAALAHGLGVGETAVRRARNVRGIEPAEPRPEVDWSLVPLGRASDYVIACLIGVSQRTVRLARVGRGIRAASRRRLPEACDSIWPLIDWSRFQLGKLPDKEIARQAGVAVSWIRRARKQLGVKQYLAQTTSEPSPLRVVCECGNWKRRTDLSCTRCFDLDFMAYKGVKGAIVSELRVLGASTAGQIVRALGWESQASAIVRQMSELIADGVVKKFEDDEDQVYYALAADVGRGC